MPKSGVITEEFARRLGVALRWVERLMQLEGTPTPQKNYRGRGFIPIVWVKLTEDLLRDNIASGTLLYQDDDPDADGTGGDWSEGADDDDTVIVYAKHLTGTINLIPVDYKLASGCVVACSRNPQSGLLNLLQSTCCPVPV